MAAGLTSASGLLSLLEEPEEKLKIYALEKLNDLVDEFWAEISDNIQQIEVLNENEQFKARELAALVASKVYYHIGSFKNAMIFALAAGPLFNINDGSLFTRTLVGKCIDEYIRQRTDTKKGEDSGISLRGLEKIVDTIFEQSFENGEFKYALGIAIESRRWDRMEHAIKNSGQINDMLNYCFSLCMDVLSRDARRTVLTILVRLYRELSIPDWVRICEILTFLDDAAGVAQILANLGKGSEDDKLVAYQIAFDLCSNASQQFRLNVQKEVQKLDVDVEQQKIQQYYADMVKKKEDEEKRKQGTESAAAQPAEPAEPAEPKMSEEPKKEETEGYLAHIKTILSGTTSTNLFLEFLHRNNHTDKLVLKHIKEALDSRSSLVYSSILISHAFMNAGTTNDFFLRDNLEWLSKASNWSKFSATAALGVIQKGHFKESLNILAPYLPPGGQAGSGSPYSEGGSLYALGLIHANHGEEITSFLKTALAGAGTNEIVQHGACLGLGVAAMATRDFEIFEEFKTNVLYTDSAVAGEAAGIAMGLVMLGSASQEALEEMLRYAHDTQHEKIIRGLAVGIALIMCGREEEADTLIEQLVMDKDPILRYGAMYTIALAYAGTANNAAIKRLLHVAVSDVSNDVRRAAVTALGFLLFRQPKQCPELVSLLAESYNPHVRYGAALAVGIACAGTGLKEAVDLLEPLVADGVDFVRQGALIGLAMVLVQTSKGQEPRVEKVRKLFADKVADKHEDIMAKFGACLASGIIDAGGRNCTISPQSVAGHTNMIAVVGLAMFTQYWYWHPFAHFLCLAFTPTALIGLNNELKMPVFKFKSNAKPSLFAYPPKVKPPPAKTVAKVRTAELSITKKAKIRQRQKEKEKEDAKKGEGADAMDIDEKKPAVEEPKKPEEEPKKEEPKKEEEKPEAESEELNNPARVTVRQSKVLSFDVDDRYSPVKRDRVLGIVMLHDSQSGEPPVYVTPAKPPSPTEEDDEDEADPPEPFDFDPTKEKD